jgi:outer membrane protein assembly factor BamA
VYQAPIHSLELFARHDRETPHAAADVDRAPFETGRSRSVGASYVFNRLTTDYFPLAGSRIAASIERGVSAFGSDWTFTRATVRGEGYAPLGTRLKLAVAGSHGSLFGAGPIQKSLALIEDAGFVRDGLRNVRTQSLTALNVEVRSSLIGSSLAVALFAHGARTSRNNTSISRTYGEAGIGLRFFDNAPFAMQIDWPLWIGGPGVDELRRLDTRRFVLRVGRVFEGRP